MTESFPTAAPCPNHSLNPSTATCERCGNFMCDLCTLPVERRVYCPSCFEYMHTRGAIGLQHQHFALPGWALGLGLISTLGCMTICLNLPFGIAGICVSAAAMRRFRNQPDLPGRGINTAGMVLSVVGIILSAAMIGLIGFASMIGK